MGAKRDAVTAGAKAVLRTGSVFDLSPEAVAFAGGIEVGDVYAEFPASEKTSNLGEIVLDIAETTLNDLMVEGKDQQPRRDRARHRRNDPQRPHGRSHLP